MIKKTILSLFVTILITSSSYTQTINLTNPTMTPVQAVENILLGAGINAFNITYNGSAADANIAQQSVRSFNAGTSVFPIQEGVLLNTYQSQPISDPDLDMIASEDVENGVIIEFDFVPTGDTLSFNYIFASSEYEDYTCSGFNDVFGFFISGPGISGPFSNGGINIATVPGSPTIPVGINSVNSGVPSTITGVNCFAVDPNWQSNSSYFSSAYTSVFTSVPHGAYLGIPTPYNGNTVVLPANSSLTCNDTFHIKMAITNIGDPQYDSGVFLEANSFSSGGVDINIESNSAIGDSTLIEGCTQGNVYFTRPANQTTDSLIIYFEVTGTADSGVDFPELAPGDSVVFVPGQDSITLTIDPIDEGVSEVPQSVIISSFFVSKCGDTTYSEGTIWIVDEPNFTINSTDTIIYCANDSVPLWVATSGGVAPYNYSWNNGQTGSNVFGEALQNGIYEFIVTSTDVCGFETSDTARVVLDQKLKIDSLTQVPADCGMENGSVVGFGDPTSYTGTSAFEWSGPGGDSPDIINSATWQNKPSGWYYFTLSDDVCSVMDSILLEQNPAPSASFDADPITGGSPLNVTFTNTSDPATTYDWDFGNGLSNTVNDMSDQNSTYIDEGSYTVTLTLMEGTCTDQATKIVTVALPVSYDMPNIFTPNGDDENDFFTINAENAVSLEVVILNRWGSVVFESTALNFKWNGKVNNSGAECTDGTYFYKFKLTDSSGEVTEEHGFVQLVSGE